MIFLALRHLFTRKKQTLFTLSGIFLGTLAFIVISALMLGGREYFLNELVHNDAHIHISAKEELIQEHSMDLYFNKDPLSHIFWNSPPSGQVNGEAIRSPAKWIQILQNEPLVSCFSPRCFAEASLQYGRAQTSTYITGCNPKQERFITNAASHVIEGNFEDISLGNNYLAIGYQLQKKLGVRLHQTVIASATSGSKIPFRIVAIFKTDSPYIDYNSYSSLASAQGLKKTLHQITEIAVKLHDHTQASALANSWTNFEKEKIESWDKINANLFKMFIIQDAIRFFCIGAVLAVAGFGIYNVLNMTVMQKRKDIAILRSMGFSSKEIIFLFFSQGLILGIAGAILGILFGHLLGMYLGTISIGSGGAYDFGPDHILVSKDPGIYLQAFFLGLFSSCLASFIPARAASKLSPIEIIRAGAD